MPKKVSSETIEQRLANLFRRRLGFLPERRAFDKPLMGPEVGFEPRDLIYLFFDIEAEFEIRIPQEKIAAGQFDTFDHIAGIIQEQISLQSENHHESAVLSERAL
ncbi:MAG TPA: peptide maturation system acyl carrier-related protein [Bacillota bacterium]|nr:peptide maturation system acyl carrier-related protein [Bacillota bacterium]